MAKDAKSAWNGPVARRLRQLRRAEGFGASMEHVTRVAGCKAGIKITPSEKFLHAM